MWQLVKESFSGDEVNTLLAITEQMIEWDLAFDNKKIQFSQLVLMIGHSDCGYFINTSM